MQIFVFSSGNILSITKADRSTIRKGAECSDDGRRINEVCALRDAPEDGRVALRAQTLPFLTWFSV